MAKKWSLTDVWNGAFQQMEDEPIKARPYLHASELGAPFIETFLKMKGTPYTNTFTGANRRKMEMGKMMEAIVRFVLKRAGILKMNQENVDYQIPGYLETHGRLDFVAGGAVDLQQADECNALIKVMFDELAFPKIFQWIADQTLQYARQLAGRPNQPLDLYVLEIKSVGDFMYRLLEKATRALNFHHMQGFHYLLGKGMKTGKVTYVSREDGRLLEKIIQNNGDSYREYEAWIVKMTDFYNGGVRPPLEPLILFDETNCSFTKNIIGVEWSKYLSMLYGFETAQDYRNFAEPKVKNWNYVYKRCVECQNLTAGNKDHITEARKMFPEWDRMVDMGKLRGVLMQDNGEAVA